MYPLLHHYLCLSKISCFPGLFFQPDVDNSPLITFSPQNQGSMNPYLNSLDHNMHGKSAVNLSYSSRVATVDKCIVFNQLCFPTLKIIYLEIGFHFCLHDIFVLLNHNKIFWLTFDEIWIRSEYKWIVVLIIIN